MSQERPGLASLFARITTRPQQGEATPARQALSSQKPRVARYSLPGQAIFLRLLVYEDSEEAGDEPVECLQAGKGYKVVLSTARVSQYDRQPDIEVNEGFTLELRCHMSTSYKLNLPRKKLDFVEESFRKQVWYVRLPEDVPACETTLKFFCQAAGRENGFIAVKQTFKTYSSGTLADQELIDSYYLSVKPDARMASFVVAPHPEGTGFIMKGWSSLGGMYDESKSTLLARLFGLMQRNYILEGIPGKYPLEGVLGKVRTYSRQSLGNFKDWFNRLYTRYQEKLTLIFIDMTDLEIPWELFQIGDYEYLGALVRVARWLPPTNRCTLKIGDGECFEGSAIGYIDQGLGEPATERERLAVEQFGKIYDDLYQLKAQIEQSLTTTGLIYVATHGDRGAVLQPLRSRLLLAYQMGMYPLPPSPHTLAMFNTCDSGRILNGKSDDGSFAEILLRYVIGGFIGTLGAVGSAWASHIAASLLEQASKEDELPVSEILRRLRAETVKNLSERITASEEEKKNAMREVLYTFMYVYYGNPLACLRLRAASKEESR